MQTQEKKNVVTTVKIKQPGAQRPVHFYSLVEAA
jgi:predicted transcriptional regulator